MADKKFTPLSNTEIAAFCSQIAIILKSGISSIEGISIMLEDSQSAEEKELLSAVNDTPDADRKPDTGTGRFPCVSGLHDLHGPDRRTDRKPG